MAQIVFDQMIKVSDSQMATWFVWPSASERMVVGKVLQGNRQRAFAAYYNQNPEKSWLKISETEFTTFYNSAALVAGSLFVCSGCFFHSTVAGDQSLLLDAFDRSGQRVWQSIYSHDKAALRGFQVTATQDDGFIVTAEELRQDCETVFTRVVKYNRTKNGFAIAWAEAFPGVTTYSVIEAEAGYTLAGAKAAENMYANPHVFHIDEGGKLVWETTVTDVQSYVLLDTGLIAAANGDYVVAAGAAIVRLDAKGKVIWARDNDSVKLNSVTELPDGELAFAGVLITQNMDKAYLMVLDADGQRICWDNTAVLFSSAAIQVQTINGLPVCCGYAPYEDMKNIAWLAAFAHEGDFTSAGTTGFE